MASSEGFIQVLVICLLFVQNTQQQVQKPLKVKLVGNRKEHVSCPEGNVAVVTAVKYKIDHKENHPCQDIGIGIMNRLCKFKRYCLLKKTLNCIRTADVYRGCLSRINLAVEQLGFGVIASENYPTANRETDCGFKFMLQERMAVKLTILDCFYEVRIDNTKLCDSNTKLPIERTINTTSSITYHQGKRFYEGFLALYSGRFSGKYTGEDFGTTTATKHDLAGADSTKKGLVIGLVLLSMVMVLMVAVSCFLYQRWYKPLNKKDPTPGMKYQPPRISFRTLSKNPDDDMAEVMYHTVDDGDAGSLDETQQYACVEYRTFPGTSEMIMAGSHSGALGVGEREYMDVDISDVSISTSNNLYEQTESTQEAPLYAEVQKEKTVVGNQSDTISPDQPDTGPLYAQVNKHSEGPVYAQVKKVSPDKPDVGPVYAEVNKPKKRAASSDTSEGESVYVTTQGVWSGTDAH